MGGPGIIYQSFALTAQLARALKVPVMAGGGLTHMGRWDQLHDVGATLVTACTVVMWEELRRNQDIVDGMERYMNDSGYSSWQDIIGLSLPYLKPAREHSLYLERR